LVIAAVLAAGDVWAILQLTAREHDEAREQAVLASAREAASRLLTIDSRDPRGAVDGLVRLSTGEFRARIDADRGMYEAASRDAAVSSTASIKEVGIQAVSATSASVLVSAMNSVKSGTTTAPTPRQYHLKMQLDDGPSGWLVSRVEFLP
jgi:serine/threonine-protein kinase